MVKPLSLEAQVRRQTGQAGASLVGAGVTLLIISIAIAGAISLGLRAMAVQRTQSLISQLDLIAKTAYVVSQSSLIGYGHITAALLAGSGDFPANQIELSGALKVGLQDIFHGTVFVDPVSAYGSPVDNAITVTFTNVNRPTCVSMAINTQMGGIENVVIVPGVSSDPGYIPPPSLTHMMRLPVSTAQSMCQAGEANESRTR